jgi:hypothetical protein
MEVKFLREHLMHSLPLSLETELLGIRYKLILWPRGMENEKQCARRKPKNVRSKIFFGYITVIQLVETFHPFTEIVFAVFTCYVCNRTASVVSGQSSWVQIQRFGFDSWRYQIF